jgi:hypothetical protein
VVAVGAPARLHDVALRHLRGQAGGRADALDVHDDARDLAGHGEAEVLLHEREAGPEVAVAARSRQLMAHDGGDEHDPSIRIRCCRPGRRPSTSAISDEG